MYWAAKRFEALSVNLGLRHLRLDLRLGDGLKAQALQARVERVKVAAVAGLVGL